MSRTMSVNPLWLFQIFPWLRWWPRVGRESLRADLIAGLTGAIIVLPQGVAFAVIAGLPPEYGLYTAMVPAIIAALFGSSWHLVSGPTTAISIVVFGALSVMAEPGTAHYIELALTLTFLTGLFQLAMGVARLGAVVNFISHTVVVGFTAGAAILIASSQIKNFFGVDLPRGAGFAETIWTFVHRLSQINPYVLTVAVVTLLTGILIRRYAPRLPYMIAAMLAGSLVAFLFNHFLGDARTGIRLLGALPAQLPPLSLPDFDPKALSQLAPAALAVAMLGLTEAVSIARAVAARAEQRIDGNQEFIGQGLSNIVGSFFSSYASSGSFNRSGLNYEAGARTPLAAVFASIVLGIILLLVAPLMAYLPIAAMAAVLFLVAYGLIDFHHIGEILRASKRETAILLTTFLSTLFVQLEFAIYLGVMLSLIFYLLRTSKPNVAAVTPDPESPYRPLVTRADLPQCPQVLMVRIDGSLFFGAVNHVEQRLGELAQQYPERRILVINGRSINFVDIAGAETLVQEARRWRRRGGDLYIYGLKPAALAILERGKFLEELGRERVLSSRDEVIRRVYPGLDRDICAGCDARIFTECRQGETKVQRLASARA
ncbi:MAG: SulP family inorganic anion transporter [Acidithiobacillus sp.]